ncbi:hypothetical protein SOVF_201580 [Spinacia oleracea]|nr:hypothetical protein SOVF_201580 [Spinacia oleracea]
MGESVDGGEMFKRIFVMFAFSVFFAPIANRTVDFGLVKVLEDVDEIKNLDLHGYVHERLCRAIRKYKTSGCQGNFGGCLWVLQVVYFRRLQFRAIAESCSLPLMKHWSGTKIHGRLVLEKDSACFGSGILNTVTYHVCQKLGFEDGFSKICGRNDVANDDENHIRFIIPDGQLSNSVVQSIAIDEIHAEFLKMKRNFEIFSNFDLYYTMMQELVEMVLSVQSMPRGLENIACDANPSAIPRDVSPNEKIQEVLHQINVNEIGNETVVHFDEARIVDAITDPTQQTNAGTTMEVGVQPNLSEQSVAPLPSVQPLPSVDPLQSVAPLPSHETASKELKVYDPTVGYHSIIHSSLCNGKAKVRIPCGKVNVEPFLVGYFMRFYKRNMKRMPELHQEVADYCLVDDLVVVDAEETLVWFDPVHMIQKEDMLSLAEDHEIYLSIIECWALMINVNEMQNASPPSKFCFGVRQSEILELLWQYSTNEAAMDQLLCDLLGSFLDDKGHNHEGDIGTFAMEEVEFDWKNPKGSDLDCGVYTMIGMLTFEGIKCSCPDLKEPRQRIIMRAEICATLVLSDMNDKQAEVLKHVADFNPKRAAVLPDVLKRRKKKLVDQKKTEKLMKEADKKEKELEKNANDKEEPEKNDKDKKQLKENDNEAEGDKVPLKTFISRKHLKRNLHEPSDPENVEQPAKKLALIKQTAKKPTA